MIWRIYKSYGNIFLFKCYNHFSKKTIFQKVDFFEPASIGVIIGFINGIKFKMLNIKKANYQQTSNFLYIFELKLPKFLQKLGLKLILFLFILF